jgi:hypothetical protein
MPFVHIDSGTPLRLGDVHAFMNQGLKHSRTAGNLLLSVNMSINNMHTHVKKTMTIQA